MPNIKEARPYRPPAHLSKVSSEEKNDPLHRDVVFPDSGEEFRARATNCCITRAFRFSEIVKPTYDNVAAVNPPFAELVPLNATLYGLECCTCINQMDLKLTTNDDKRIR